MPTNLRQQGVYGDNLPTKKAVTVQASDFNIGGVVGLFERRFRVPMECNNITEFQEKLGDQNISTYYGWDVVKGFFDNIAGVTGKLYVVGHAGWNGAAYDGVAATVSLNDTGPNPTLRLDAAYKEELDYSTSGNRTGYTITNGTRFTTDISVATTKDDTFIRATSVAGMRVGDVLKVVATGGGGATVYKKITALDESTGKVEFSGAFHGAANPEVGDAVTIPGFRLRTYRKSISGVEKEVDEGLGLIWCTMEDEVTDFFVENVFANSKWIKCTDLDSASALGSTFPADVTTVTYLTGGSNGTSPTTSAHWAPSLLALNDYPVRIIVNGDSTVEAVQKAIETYCQGRDDKPKTIYNIAEDQTESQLKTIGASFQRSDDVLGVIVGDWVTVEDPFATSSLSPDRHVPNVGHAMGAWIRAIGLKGIHYIPSVRDIPLFGITGIVRSTIFSATTRTELAEYGVNIIEFVPGSGYLMRNFYTPSISTEFQFANGILMREYIKISAVDSLQSSENTPNSFARIKDDASAVDTFLRRLWDRGSTGNAPEGETFGISLNEDGSPTVYEDHITVQADIVNNPQSSINAGERNIDVWFTYPTPAGSIKIGVGIQLRS